MKDNLCKLHPSSGEDRHDCENDECSTPDIKEETTCSFTDEPAPITKQSICYHSTSLFPIFYFAISIVSCVMLILLNFAHERYSVKLPKSPLHPFPMFESLRHIQPMIFYIMTFSLAFLGLLLDWFYCSMLLQRFSVPEMMSKKFLIHVMFICGILANVSLVFLGFAPEILRIETVDISSVKISLTTIIYLTFIALNVIFSVLAINMMEMLGTQSTKYSNPGLSKDELNLKKKIRMKRCLVYLAIFMICIYICAIIVKSNEPMSHNHMKKKYNIIDYPMQLVLFLMPYALYIFNSFLNLSFYSEIIYIQSSLSTIIDRDFFLSEEDVYLVC